MINSYALFIILICLFNSCQNIDNCEGKNMRCKNNNLYSINNTSIDFLNKIAKWHIYSLNEKKVSLLKEINQKRHIVNIFDINFYIYDISTRSDTLIFTYEPVINDTQVSLSPDFSTQIMFKEKKVIGLGYGDHFLIFSNNSQSCSTFVEMNYDFINKYNNGILGANDWIKNNAVLSNYIFCE